jgi:hypothetical protein
LCLDDENCSQLVALKAKATDLRRKNTRQATPCWRDGRNSPLEFAQQATLASVATSGLARQCNSFAQARSNAALQQQIHNRVQNE